MRVLEAYRSWKPVGSGGRKAVGLAELSVRRCFFLGGAVFTAVSFAASESDSESE